MTQLLAETQRQRDYLENEVQAQRGQIERLETERQEIGRALTNAQQQLHAFLGISPSQNVSENNDRGAQFQRGPANGRSVVASNNWWRGAEDKKSLGAGLTITGVVAVLMGLILHTALQQNIILTESHLGYIVGLIGLLLFLIGLVVVF